MVTEEIFNIIRSLSKKQKSNFSRFMREKSDNKIMVLYDRIRNVNEINERNLNKIKGSEFTNTQVFSKYRAKLLKAIIHSLVYYKNETVSSIQYIRTAFEINAVSEAKKLVYKELMDLEEQEDFVRLLALHELMIELQERHGHRINIPPGRLTTDQVVTCLSQKRLLVGLLDRIRDTIPLEGNERIDACEKIIKDLPTHLLSQENRNLANKIKMNIAFLRGQYDLAYSVGELLIASLRNEKLRYPVASLAREIRFLSMNATVLKMKMKAVKYFMLLSTLNPSNGYEAKEVAISIVMSGAAIASDFVDVQVAETTYFDLRAIQGSISQKIKCLILNNVGRAFFFQENYEKAEKVFQELRNSVPNGATYLRWEPQTYLSICRYRLERFDTIDSLIRSASRSVVKDKHIYPKLAIQAIKAFCIKHEVPSVEIENYLVQCSEDPNEIRATYNFPVYVWAHATRNSIPLIESHKLFNEREKVLKMPLVYL